MLSAAFDSKEELAKWGFVKGSSPNGCQFCGIQNSEIGGVMMQCGKCKRVYYCSVKCFNSDLEAHRLFCKTGELCKEPERQPMINPEWPKSPVANSDKHSQKRQKAVEWYMRLGKPTRATFEAALEKTKGIDLELHDIASLPWRTAGKTLWHNKIPDDRRAKSAENNEIPSKQLLVGDGEDRKARLAKALEWHEKLKQPNRHVFRRIVSETEGIELTNDDIDLLPWNETYEFLVDMKPDTDEEDTRERAARKAEAEAEAARKRAEAEAAARNKRAEEEAARRRAQEEHARKKAEEEAARKKAQEEAERQKAAEEAARKQAEAEAARKAAEAARKAAEAEAARKRAEQEAQRKAAEAEAERMAAEAERKAAEAEAEAARKKAAEEAERKAAEAEAARKKAAEEAARKAAEAEAIAARKKAAEEAARKAAEAEAARKKSQEEAASKKADDDASRKEATVPAKKTVQVPITEEGRFLSIYDWYLFLATPTRADFKRRMAALTYDESQGLTADDVDLLPWSARGLWVDIAAVQEQVLEYQQLETERGNPLPWEKRRKGLGASECGREALA